MVLTIDLNLLSYILHVSKRTKSFWNFIKIVLILLEVVIINYIAQFSGAGILGSWVKSVLIFIIVVVFAYLISKISAR